MTGLFIFVVLSVLAFLVMGWIVIFALGWTIKLAVWLVMMIVGAINGRRQ